MSAVALNDNKINSISTKYLTDDNVDKAQKLLLATTVACAAISLIPPLRLAGAMMLRSVAFLSSSLSCANHWNKTDSNFERVLKCAKIAAVTVGLVGVAISSPMLIIASLAADIAINLFEAIKAFQNEEFTKGFMHLAVIVIDSLALSAVVVGSWQLMVSAAAVSAAAMCALAIATIIKNGISVESISYIALMGIGIAAAATIGEDVTSEKRMAAGEKYNVRNNTASPVSYYNTRGELIATLQPGESRTLEVLTVDTWGKYHSIYRGESINNGNIISGTWIKPSAPNWDAGFIVTREASIREAIKPELFPTVPVDGTAVFIPASR